MTYDQKCYDLAVVFLSDVQDPVQHEDAHRLAQEIARVIDDFLEELSPPDVDRSYEEGLKSLAKTWDKVIDTLFTPKVAK